MRKVVIVDGVRTAIGRMGGTLAGFRPEELAAFALRGLLEKTGIDPEIIDDVLIGHACTNNGAVNIARWATLKAGFPVTVPAQTVERQCGSSLQTVNSSAMAIMAGFGDVFIAGGCESWSTQPYLMERQTKPFSLNPLRYITREAGPGEYAVPMGIIAEGMADKWGITREEQDLYGLRSQTKAINAIESGYFTQEIIPVTIPQRKGDPIIFDKDEHPRATSLEKLAALRPSFKKDGSVTAGTSSGLNDGAVAILMMSDDRCNDLGYAPLGRFVAGTVVGVEPKYMGIGPAYAIPKVLDLAGLNIKDLDVIECNEAFASQTLAVMKELSLNGYAIEEEKWNPNGGAIAFGHPNGVSGGRLALAALNQLKRINGRYGLVTLCIGGGQGIASIFERV